MGLAGSGFYNREAQRSKGPGGSLGCQPFCLLRASPEPSSLKLPNKQHWVPLGFTPCPVPEPVIPGQEGGASTSWGEAWAPAPSAQWP